MALGSGRQDGGQVSVVGRIRERLSRLCFKYWLCQPWEYEFLFFSILFLPLSVIQRFYGKQYCLQLVIMKINVWLRSVTLSLRASQWCSKALANSAHSRHPQACRRDIYGKIRIISSANLSPQQQKRTIPIRSCIVKQYIALRTKTLLWTRCATVT